MKVGDYVRNRYGEIFKLNNIIYQDDNYIQYQLGGKLEDKDYIKSSPNIIDLIEVGDYVNGLPVEEVLLNDGIYIHRADDKYDRDIYIVQEDIKSILTKEQFKSMEYKIGE